jgi:hypothetical protein
MRAPWIPLGRGNKGFFRKRALRAGMLKDVDEVQYG